MTNSADDSDYEVVMNDNIEDEGGGFYKVTFDPNEDTSTLSIMGVDDNDVETQEWFKVVITSVDAVDHTPSVDVYHSQSFGGIDDDDQVVNISIDDGLASEDGDTATFVVSRGPDSSAELDVPITFSGAAVKGTDYTTSLSGGSSPYVHFDEDENVVTFSITPIDDATTEDPEDVLATLGAPGADDVYTIEEGYNWASAIITDEPLDAPAAPTDLNAVPLSRNDVELAWKQPGGGGYPDGFIIQVSTDDGATFTPHDQVYDSTARSFDVSGLDPDTDYVFRVDAAIDDLDGNLLDDDNDIVTTGEDTDHDGATTTDDQWQDIDTVTPDINTGDLSYFSNGDDLAAGRYRLVYVSGAVNYDHSEEQDDPQWVAMEYVASASEDVNNDYITGQAYPGNQDGYEVQDTLEEAEYEATPTLCGFTHLAEGPIGMELDNYSEDNTGPGVTWKLQRYVPHVSVVVVGTSDVAIEGSDETPARLHFYTDDHFGEDLTVQFALSGTATEQDETQFAAVLVADGYDDQEIDLSDGEITIPGDLNDVELDITAVDDTTPEWTQDLGLRLTEDDQPSYVANHFYDNDETDSDGDGHDEDVDATVYLQDNDPVDIEIQGLSEEADDEEFNEMDPGATITVNDDDDNDDSVPDGEADQADMDDDDLEPVELNVPAGNKPGTELTLSMAETDADKFRVWSADGTQLLGIFNHTGDPVLTTSIDADGNPSVTVYIEATEDPSTVLTLTGEDSGTYAGSSSSDSCAVSTGDDATGDVDLTTISHNEPDGVMDDQYEQTEGAFVPLNDDDDDYNDTGPSADYEQSTAVTGEDDLLPIIVRSTSDDEAVVTLAFPVGLRIYRNSDRSSAITTATDLNSSNDETYYVEGRIKGQHHVELMVDGKKADDVKITVFKWVGPLNVPQYGNYEYRVEEPTPDPGAQWLNPTGGIMTSRTLPNPSDVDIYWLGGAPRVGHAIYQVNNSYTWDLEVNVVGVHVGAPDLGQAFIAGAVNDDGKAKDNADRKVKLIEADGPGIQWNAKVEFDGPNGNRGVKQMLAGFVQNLKVTNLSGQYLNGTLRSVMQGSTFWDTKNSHEKSFYSSSPGAFFKNPTAISNSKTISEDDSPGWGPPLVNFKNGSPLTSMKLVWDFNLFVAVQTRDERNAAQKVYVAESEVHWSFKGSGTIAGEAWTGTGSGVSVPTGWAGAITDEMLTTDPRFNDTFKNAGWV